MASVLPRPGAEPVCNLAVDVEHAYDVSSSGVPPHNAAPGCRVHANSTGRKKPNHVYEIRNKATGKVVKYGVSSGKIGRDGRSYLATKQVNAMNKGLATPRYDAKVIAKNLPRVKALRMERGSVSGYGEARVRAGNRLKGPPRTKLAVVENVREKYPRRGQ